MKTRIMVLGLILGTFFSEQVCAQRQEVVATSGDYFKNSNGSITFTLGEPVTELFSAPGKKLTQGFQQPRTAPVTAVYEAENLRINVFPNPTTELLTLYVEEPRDVSYRLFDLVGRVVSQQVFSGAETVISLEGLAPGLYLMEVRKGPDTVSIFRIIKQ